MVTKETWCLVHDGWLRRWLLKGQSRRWLLRMPGTWYVMRLVVAVTPEHAP